MSTDLIQVKRNQFAAMIRKQALDSIFKVKRQQSNVETKYSPNFLLQQIQKTFKFKNFPKLLMILKQYNDDLLLQLNMFIGQNSNLLMMTLFLSHIHVPRNAKVFYNLLRLRNVPKGGVMPLNCFDCLNQTLVIIKNFTFLNGQTMVTKLLEQGILNILLKDVLFIIEGQLAQNFDQCQISCQNICNILTNLLLDEKGKEETKEIILDSNLIEICQQMFYQGMENSTLRIILSLFNFLFAGSVCPKYKTNNTHSIIQICIDTINQKEVEPKTYEQVLKLLIQLSQHQPDILKQTRVVWDKILSINQHPLLQITLFINLTSLHNIESYLINIGLIENMVKHLYDKKQNSKLISRIFQLLNILMCQEHSKLVEACFNHFIPYLKICILEKPYEQSDKIQEYISMLMSLFTNQQLTNDNFMTLIIDLDIIQTIIYILRINKPCFSLMLQLFLIFDKLSLNLKQCIYQKIEQNQLIDLIINNDFQLRIRNDEIIERIVKVIDHWEEECNNLNQK